MVARSSVVYRDDGGGAQEAGGAGTEVIHQLVDLGTIAEEKLRLRHSGRNRKHLPPPLLRAEAVHSRVHRNGAAQRTLQQIGSLASLLGVARHQNHGWFRKQSRSCEHADPNGSGNDCRMNNHANKLSSSNARTCLNNYLKSHALRRLGNTK